MKYIAKIAIVLFTFWLAIPTIAQTPKKEVRAFWVIDRMEIDVAENYRYLEHRKCARNPRTKRRVNHVARLGKSS